jgi:hypothetical protein
MIPLFCFLALACGDSFSTKIPDGVEAIDSTTSVARNLPSSSVVANCTNHDTITTFHKWGNEKQVSLGILAIDNDTYQVYSIVKTIQLANGPKQEQLLVFESSNGASRFYDFEDLANLPGCIDGNELIFDVGEDFFCRESNIEIGDLICVDCLNSRCFLELFP